MITAEQAQKISEGETLVDSDGLHINFEQVILVAAGIGDFGTYMAVNATNLKMLRSYGYWVNGYEEPEDDTRSERMFVDWSGRFTE